MDAAYLQDGRPQTGDEATLIVRTARGVLFKTKNLLTALSSSSTISASPLLPSSAVTYDGVLRGSLADTLSNIARDDEITTLKNELQECRDDLERDEEIFAEKIRELKSCRKLLRAAQHENNELQEKITNDLSQSKRIETEMKRRIEMEGRELRDSGEKECKREYKHDTNFSRNGQTYGQTSHTNELCERETEERDHMKAEVKNISYRKGDSSHERKNITDIQTGDYQLKLSICLYYVENL